MAKTSTAIVLDQDGSIREFEYADGDYKPLQEAVGGLIESVSYWFKNIDAYVNEEGLYTPGLVPNPHAGRALAQEWMGNIVIPRVTPAKRARLIKMGFKVNPA